MISNQVRIFTTRPITKFLDSILALTFGVAVVVIVPAGAGFVGWLVDALTGLTWLAIFVAVFALLVVGRWAWKGVVEPLRFCVVVQRDVLQLGRGLARLKLDYADIEEITAFDDGTNGTGIAFRARGEDTSVRLSINDTIECFELLQDYCPYAVFTDIEGREFIKQEKPELALPMIQRHKYRSGWRWTVAFVSSAFSTVWQIFITIQWSRGEFHATAAEVVRTCIVAMLMSVATVACFIEARKAFRLARIARFEREMLP